MDGLSSTRFTTVLRRPGDHFVKQQCRHCLEPACVSACLVGAMQKTPEGPVIYDSELCMGCRYCLVACPYGIPRYEWDEAVPYVRKCNLCYPRLQEGSEPACVEACPHEALLVRDAGRPAPRGPPPHPRRSRAATWTTCAGRRRWGARRCSISPTSPSGFLGWGGDLGDRPLPVLSWASLEKVPPVVVGMATLMGGIHWVIRRRMQLAARAADEAAGGDEA